jgi:hypothetical protein
MPFLIPLCQSTSKTLPLKDLTEAMLDPCLHPMIDEAPDKFAF